MYNYVFTPMVGLITVVILFLIFRQICFIIAKYDKTVHKLDDNKFFKGLDSEYIFGCLIITVAGIAVLLLIYVILVVIGSVVINTLF